jgi:hypothetical protein
MARPTTKAGLLDGAASGWDKLWAVIARLPDPGAVRLDFGGDPALTEAHWRRDQNLRDVVVHLWGWHQLLIDWCRANLAGARVGFLPEPYTWKTYGQFNQQLWKDHQSTTYQEAVARLQASHAEVMAIIAALSEEELFVKQHFPWTGTTNLASYGISVTSAHYEWAAKKLARHLRGQA